MNIAENRSLQFDLENSAKLKYITPSNTAQIQMALQKEINAALYILLFLNNNGLFNLGYQVYLFSAINTRDKGFEIQVKTLLSVFFCM